MCVLSRVVCVIPGRNSSSSVIRRRPSARVAACPEMKFLFVNTDGGRMHFGHKPDPGTWYITLRLEDNACEQTSGFRFAPVCFMLVTAQQFPKFNRYLYT